MTRKLTCAFVTYYPMPDVGAYSGTSYFMTSYLQKAGVDVHFVYDSLPAPSLFFRLRRKIYRKLLGRGMREDRDPGILRAVTQKIRRKLDDLQFDFILSPGSLPIAYLQHEKPCFLWSDSTFAAYINYLDEFFDMSPETIWRGHQTERAALANCARAVYACDWAANSARTNYGNPDGKIVVIPYGANLNVIPEAAAVEQAITRRTMEVFRLLFIGIEWERKGGPKVLRIVEELVRRGCQVRLDIVGCQPDIPESLRASVVVHGFVSKKTPEGLEKLWKLLMEAHFLIVLSVAEAYGIVFCEAAAFGVPSLAHREGGMTTAVEDGVSGQLFALNSEPAVVADYIARTLTKEANYPTLARRSRQHYDQRLNWPTAIASFLGEVEKCLK